MFLKKTKRSYKQKGYENYALTESYREEGKVKHKHIANLGALTPEQAQRIRLVLKVQNIEEAYVGPLADVVAKKHYRFLDVAVLDALWRRFALDEFFARQLYPEAMAVNRCLEPKTKIRIKAWAEGTVLPRLAHQIFQGEYEVYRVLDEIAEREEDLQEHLHQQYLKQGLMADNVFFYDITSSYFEGNRCVIATYGYSRDHRPDRKQIVIALVITPDGFPVYWQVLPGNVQDVTTVKELLCVLKERFGIEKCLLVFDRGMVSAENLQAFLEQDFTYISALDRDEIKGLGFLESDFSEFLKGNWRDNLLAKGFSVYDEYTLYREHTYLEKRYLIAYNRLFYNEQQKNRKVRFEKAEQFIASYNEELNRAQRSRSEKATANKITNRLRNLKMQKVFSYRLQPLTLIAHSVKGKQKQVRSFSIDYTVNETELARLEYLDGVCCFVTNAPALTAQQIIGAYRRKNKIEEAFREIKSYLKVRPFHLTREERVRAHVSICTLGYLMLNALEEDLKHSFEQPLSAPAALDIFSQCQLNRIGPKNSDTFVESITELTTEQVELLHGLGLDHLTKKKFLGQILEHSFL